MPKRGRNLNKPRVRDKNRLKNSPLSKLWDRAKKAWEQGDLEGCGVLLGKMERLSPDNPNIHLELGRLNGRLQNYEESEHHFDRCIALAPEGDKGSILSQVCRMSGEFYEPKLGEKYYEQTLKSDRVEPDLLVDFAMFRERQSPEKAAELIEQALSGDSDHLGARRMKGHLLQKSGDFDSAEETLRPLTGRDIPPEIRARAGYDLGALLDRTGRYDEAMEAFVLAKSMMYEDGVRLRNQRTESIQRIRQLREQITPEVFQRWHDQGQELQPQHRLALLGGHPRSGTTLLEQVLDSHSDICSAEETLHFRDQIIRPMTPKGASKDRIPTLEVWDSASTDQLQSMRRDYFAAMDKAVGGSVGDRLLIDKNPSLTLSTATLSRCFPELKFLIALRDPRDVVMSCFMQPMFPLQQVNATWLQLGSAAEEYANLMGTWLDFEPMLQNPHLTVRYEDMVEDLEPVARKCLEFFDVPWNDRVLDFHKHAQQRRVRSPTFTEVTKKIFTSSRGRWRNYEKFLEPHLHTLDPFLKAFGYE